MKENFASVQRSETPSLSVSVIVPTYNRPDLLREAIASLLSQTRVPDEIIVVDDGSTDNTSMMLQDYGAPIIVVRRPNGGLSAARNSGLEKANGDLIAFLDDDDTLTPDSIDVRASFLEQHPDIHVVYGDIEITDLEGNRQGRYSVVSGFAAPSGYVFPALIKLNWRPVHAYMCRRDALKHVGTFKEGLAHTEDWQYWLRLAVHYDFHYLDKVMGYYRYHPGQSIVASARKRLRQELEIQVREEAFSYPAFIALSPSQKARIFSFHATQYALMGDYGMARRWYRSAIRQWPLLLRPYLLLGLTWLGKGGLATASRIYSALRRS